MLGWRTGRTGVASEKVRFLCLNQSSKGAEYALDDFRNTAGPVVAGVSEFVHLGRVYSHSSSGRAGDPRDQPSQRA